MILLAILFLLALTLWLIPVVKDGGLAPILTVYLCVGTVFGPPFFALEGPVQISLDRILCVAMVGVGIIRWRLGKLRLPSLARIDVALVWLVLFLGWRSRGGDLVETEINPTARWLFYILLPFVVYLVARAARFRQLDFRRLLWGIIALGVYLSLTAVCEIQGWHGLVFPKHILDPQQWMFLGRGRGPLLNPIGNGFLIGVAIAAAAALFVGASRGGQALLLGIVPVLLAGSYATLTRSCWLGAVAAIAIVVLVHSPRWLRVWGLAVAALLAVALLMGLKDELMSIKRDKALSASEAAKSVELRPLLAIVAWEMFQDKPLLGHGYGHYLQEHDRYHTIRRYGMPLENVREYSHHNVFLAFLVDSGLVGLGLYATVLLILASDGWRLAHDFSGGLDRRRAGLFMLGVLACYLPNALFHEMTIIPMVQVFLLTAGGVIVSVAQRGFAVDAATRMAAPRRQRLATATQPAS